MSGTRKKRFTYPVRSRLDAASGLALEAASRDRGCDQSSLVRLLLQYALGAVDELDPVRRTVAPVRYPEELAAAIVTLGSLAGNVQRLYTFRLSQGINDQELVALKEDIRSTSAALRKAAGGSEVAP